MACGCKGGVLVLRDSYQSQFAWTTQDERYVRPRDPALEFRARAAWGWNTRFENYLKKPDRIEFIQINLETHQGELPLDDVRVLIVDDVRSFVLKPYCKRIVEFVKEGGSLIVVSGFYGLGGRRTDENDLSVLKTVSDYRRTALASILPVTIIRSPDYVYRRKPFKLKAEGTFFKGVPLSALEILGYHNVRLAEGANAVAEIEQGVPFIAYKDVGKGRVVVLNWGELEFVHQRRRAPFRYADLLFQRLSLLALRRQLSPPSVNELLTEPDTARHTRFFLTKDAGYSREVSSEFAEQIVRGLKGGIYRTGELAEGRYTLRASAKGEQELTLDSAIEFRALPIEGVTISIDAPQGAFRGEKVKLTVSARIPQKLETPRLVLSLKKKLSEAVCTVELPVQEGDCSVDLDTSPLSKGLYYIIAQLRAKVDGTNKPVGEAWRQFWVAELEPYFQGCLWVGRPQNEREWEDFVEHNVNVVSSPGDVLKSGGFWQCRQIRMCTSPSASPELTPEGRAELFAVGPDGKKLRSFCPNKPLFWKHAEKALRILLPKYLPYPQASIINLEDEWSNPFCYCETCRKLFRKEYGYDMPEPKPDTSPAYLQKWYDRVMFHIDTRKRYIERAVKLIHKLYGEGCLVTTSQPQGFSVFTGQEVVRTQWAVDLPWDHTYPGDMPLWTAMSAQSLESAVMLSPRPDRPRHFLLQGFAYVSRFPSMPPRAYTRLQGWLALSHGINSIGWFCYHWMRWTMPGTGAWEGVKEIGDIMRRYAPLLKQLRPKPAPIALLYNLSSESADFLRMKVRIEDHPWNPPAKGTSRLVVWRVYHALQEAYLEMKLAGIPFDCIFEEHIKRGLLPYKAIVIPNGTYLAPQIRERLERFTKDGGKVLVGKTATFELEGAEKLDVDFEEILRTFFPPGKPGETNVRRHRCFYIDSVFAKAQKLRTILAPYHEEPVRIRGSQELIWSMRDGGKDIDYLFLVNHTAFQPPPSPEEFKRWKRFRVGFFIMPLEFLSIRSEVGLKEDGRLVDVMNSVRLRPVKRGDYRWLTLQFEPGGGRMVSILSKPITTVELRARPVKGLPRLVPFGEDNGPFEFAEKLARGGSVLLSVKLKSGREDFRGAVPLEITLTDGLTTSVMYRTTHRDGILHLPLALPYDFRTGSLQIRVKEITNGVEAKMFLRIVEAQPLLHPLE